MKDLLLYGIGDFARLMKYYIENDDNRKIGGFVVDSEYNNQDITEFEGVPIINSRRLFDRKIYSDKFDILCCIGYKKMNEGRERVFRECQKHGFSMASYIHSSVKLPQNCSLDEGNIILENSLIQPFVKIGKGNIIWYGSMIAHDCVIGDFNTVTGGASLAGFVEVGNNTFLGNRCVIRNGVKIANYTLVGANVYISKNTTEGEVYVAPRAYKMEKKSWDIL